MADSTGLQALEAYLFATMTQLCGSTATLSDSDRDGRRLIDELNLFGIGIPFERVTNALGCGLTGPPRVFEGAPESLRVSVEHRYALSRWPLFEFCILESEHHAAWGQKFVRRPGVLPPPIQSPGDLRAWSHVESEVLAVLGQPETCEEWWPWKSATYRAGATEYVLCYVYDLLQRVEVGS
jgi:hypothetical protein